MENKYYVYRHIRPDKNEPFYIGVGTKPKIYRNRSTEYARALAKTSRNKIWKSIVNKNDGNLKVEIIYETNNYEDSRQKEVEFIKLYGRIDIKTGILANLTDGGEGSKNYKLPKEAYDKLVVANNSVYRKGKHNPLTKSLFIYDKFGNFIEKFDGGAKEAGIKYQCNKTAICSVAAGEVLHAKSFRFYYNYRGDKIEALGLIKNDLQKKIVYKFDKNLIFVEKFLGLQAAVDSVGGNPEHLSYVIKNNKLFKNHYWKYDMQC